MTSLRRLLCAFPVVLSVALVANASPSGAAKPVARPQANVSRIQHVVVLMQENRSYDSYFGPLHFEGQPRSSREPNRGNPNPLGGARIRPFITTQPCTTADLNHEWDATHREIDGGRMDGFTTENVDSTDPTGSRAMGSFDDQTLPFYYNLANQFAIADRYFASVPGPTYPNRFYLLTGTSFGNVTNITKTYTQKTIFQSLDEANPPVSWKVYLASAQVELLFKYVQQHTAGHVFPISQYYADAANGALPQVAFVESDPFGNPSTHESDEHPPANVQVGQRFTHDVLQALVHGPDWSSSAFFLTYDEHGGYYDHVPPPAAVPPDDIKPMVPPNDPFNAFDRLGVRVPAIVVSPYAKSHFVSHTVFDHTSILKFIETRFRLPPLTRRDAAANNMLDMFDFGRVSHPNPTLAGAPIDPAGVAQCQAVNGP